MQNQTDEQVALPMVKQTQDTFPELSTCSFDKGFHSPGNQQKLPKLLELVVLPEKGGLSQDELPLFPGHLEGTRFQKGAVGVDGICEESVVPRKLNCAYCCAHPPKKRAEHVANKNILLNLKGYLPVIIIPPHIFNQHPFFPLPPYHHELLHVRVKFTKQES